MTSRFTELAVDCRDPEALARFWCAVLDWRVNESEPGLVEIAGDEPGPTIVFAEVPEPKTVKNRIHWDVLVDSLHLVQQLTEEGATLLRAPDDEIGWTVMADPEGNEFCAFVR